MDMGFKNRQVVHIAALYPGSCTDKDWNQLEASESPIGRYRTIHPKGLYHIIDKYIIDNTL